MELNKSKEKVLYRLSPKHDGMQVKGTILSNGRILVGRTESCEMIISSAAISSVHAVLEVTDSNAKVFDMNSKNGTFVNGEKIVSSSITIGDSIRFGDCEFVLEKYSAGSTAQVLDVLEPQVGEASVLNTLPEIIPDFGMDQKPDSVEQSDKKSEDVPYVVYPLSKDPKSDYSEYIFEDTDEVHPIFKYEHSQQAVEIIILFKDTVYSVDYLPSVDGQYSIVGSSPKKDQVEFSYLGKDEQVTFVEVQSGNCIVHVLHNYTALHINDDGINENISERVNIQDNDIVKFEKGDLEIYVRKVSAPPKVKTPPFFKRDREFWKYIIIMMSIIAIVSGVTLLDLIPEKEKEKDPERIARILYKQPLTISKSKAVEKTKKAPPKKQKTKKIVVKKKPTPKPVAKKTPTKVKKAVKVAGSKKAPKVQKVKKVSKPAVKNKRPAKTKTASAAKRTTKRAQTRKANRPSKSKGAIDVYKSVDFRSTVSALAAKGGSLKGATTATSSSSNISGASIGGGVATNVKKANIGNEVGSLSGSASGKLAESKGTEGLATSKGAYVAGIPSETVVLGSMDPDVIRRILREHIPQFRYCYQKELDRRAGARVSGTVGLVFTIGASGHVTKAGVKSSSLPRHVKSCAVRVLRGIKFPRPNGGATVDVNQPFNFQPKSI